MEKISIYERLPINTDLLYDIFKSGDEHMIEIDENNKNVYVSYRYNKYLHKIKKYSDFENYMVDLKYPDIEKKKKEISLEELSTLKYGEDNFIFYDRIFRNINLNLEDSENKFEEFDVSNLSKSVKFNIVELLKYPQYKNNAAINAIINHSFVTKDPLSNPVYSKSYLVENTTIYNGDVLFGKPVAFTLFMYKNHTEIQLYEYSTIEDFVNIMSTIYYTEMYDSDFSGEIYRNYKFNNYKFIQCLCYCLVDTLGEFNK